MDVAQSHTPSRFRFRVRHMNNAMMAISRRRITNLTENGQTH